jgi:Raf kinase inhibitor-like YbhB/YbcL family protein
MAFTIESSAFANGGSIPPKHARAGDNLSPQLAWKEAPPNTRSYALIVEDPDAPSGIFRHWAACNIPRERDQLPEGAGAAPPDEVAQAVNDFGNRRYDGPQPPKGHGPHHYHFRLFALDVERLDLPSAAKVADVLSAAKRHAVAETELIGTFETR